MTDRKQIEKELVFPFEYRYSISYNDRFRERHGRRAVKVRLNDGTEFNWKEGVTLRHGFEAAIARGTTVPREEGEKNAQLVSMGILLTTSICLYDNGNESESYSLQVDSPDLLPLTVYFDPYSRDGVWRQKPMATKFMIRDGKILIVEDDPHL